MWDFFIDPIFRGPTIASMLMCLVAALSGVVVTLRKQALLGETLSHASYPGVALAIAGASFFMGDSLPGSVALIALIGAVLSSLSAVVVIHVLEKRLNVPGDAALCFVLAASFGVGLTVASRLQFTNTALYRQIQLFLYGQVATLQDHHIAIYAALTLLFLAGLFAFYKEIQVVTFDRKYAMSLGISVGAIEALLYVFITLSIVIGIRSVGVVLMAGMLIAPAIAARQWTEHLGAVFGLAGLIGILSGWMGNYLSYTIPFCASNWCGFEGLILPIGPSIVLFASLLCLASLLVAPRRGLLLRAIRVARFRSKCIRENILKAIWRQGIDSKIDEPNLSEYLQVGTVHLRLLLRSLCRQGWLEKQKDRSYVLTSTGVQRASHIIRLHRLWEVYLADYLGVGREKVHCSAEEMEHILTPEIEKELTELLKDPLYDPHQKPIPPKVQL